MKLKNIFAKRITVADGLRIPVSRHFHYSLFGVRGRYEHTSHAIDFVCDGKPGTGFFTRSSDSHSYRQFVREAKKKTQQSPMTLILGKEPNFDKESKLIDEAFKHVDNPDVRRILSSYQNVIILAKEEELLQRIVRAIKDKMGHHRDKTLTSVLSHYKSSIAT